jgi:hypothetical protein
LDEENGFLWVDPTGQKLYGHPERIVLEFLRIVGHGHGVQVHNPEDTFVLFLELAPVLDSTKVVAKVHLASGLDTGEHTFFFRSIHNSLGIRFEKFGVNEKAQHLGKEPEGLS